MFAVRNNMFTIMDNEFRIAEILKSKGMTQTDLAEKIGISRVGLSKAINGNTTITTLRKIAAALGVPVPELSPLNRRTRSPAPIAVNRSNLRKGNNFIALFQTFIAWNYNPSRIKSTKSEASG